MLKWLEILIVLVVKVYSGVLPQPLGSFPQPLGRFPEPLGGLILKTVNFF